MNKKVLYSILSTIVAMIVLSISLVFAIGPRVSADEGELIIGVLDKAEYFDIDDNGVLWGLTETGYEYMKHFSEVKVKIPDGVKILFGYSDSDNYFSIFEDYPHGGNASKIIAVEIPNSVEELRCGVFAYCRSLTSIIIPASVQIIDEPGWSYEGFPFFGCDSLTTIYCEAESKPEGWEDDWNLVDGSIWGAPKSWFDNIVWNCNKTITFDTNSGSAVDSQKVCVDSLVTMPAVPTKDGYEFKGWFVGDEEYDFATPVTADMTLTAKWEAVQTQPETHAEENDEINNQNNTGLIWGIAGTSAGILIIASIVIGIVISKRRHK